MKSIYLTVLVLLSFTSVSCQKDDNISSDNIVLSEQEITDMKFMFEEEKVAYDVYDALYRKWGLKVFGNIKESENRHMNAMKTLLERNNISFELKPEAGMFYNETLQQMYNRLIIEGMKSVKAALMVGKKIEEKDIADLKEAISQTKDSYAKNVYQNLLDASYNHLNAFNRNLSRY